MLFQVVTIFPELVDAFARIGLVAKAIEGGIMRCETPLASDAAPMFIVSPCSDAAR